MYNISGLQAIGKVENNRAWERNLHRFIDHALYPGSTKAKLSRENSKRFLVVSVSIDVFC